MSVFSDKELDYLAGKRLGRLATIDANGLPHVVPLGWSYNPALDTIDVGGRDFDRTKKFPQRPGQPQGRFGDRRRTPAVATALRHGARPCRGTGTGGQRGRRGTRTDHPHPPR